MRRPYEYIYAGSMRGGSAGTSVRGPESQEGACESLKDPIHAISIAIDFFLIVLAFQTIFSLFRKIIM